MSKSVEVIIKMTVPTMQAAKDIHDLLDEQPGVIYHFKATTLATFTFDRGPQ